jgi:hypothetical protein
VSTAALLVAALGESSPVRAEEPKKTSSDAAELAYVATSGTETSTFGF